MIKKTLYFLYAVARGLAVVWILAMAGLFAFVLRTAPIALFLIALLTAALLFRVLKPKKPKPDLRPIFNLSGSQSHSNVQKPAGEKPDSRTTKRDELFASLSPSGQKQFLANEAMIAEMLARSHDPQRAKQKPAWAIIMQSPFMENPDATSWLGGLPVAPADFEWPRDTDGKPLSFIAQIDLAEVKPEASTGLRPEGLPDRGALLAFMGQTYAFHVVSGEDMITTKPTTPPPDLEPLENHGFWIKDTVFPKWPVSLVPFMDKGEGRPTEFPDRFKNVRDWITNWGIATMEAETVIKNLEYRLRDAIEFVDRYGQEPSVTDSQTTRNARAYLLPMATHGPALLEKMKAWLIVAQSHAPESPVDQAALQEIMTARLLLKEKWEEGHHNQLAGDLEHVWDKIAWSLRKENAPHNLPAYMRPLINARIEDWRGHRLMGLEPEFPNNSEDFRGQDCVLSIHRDELLETQTEHDYGFSIWCKREDIARGHFNSGQLVRHCAV